MRPSNLISFLLVLSSFTFAIPSLRGVPQASAGLPETLADTVDLKAASSSTSKPAEIELGSPPAKSDTNGSPPDEDVDLPPGVEPTSSQQIKSVWKSGGDAVSRKFQEWLAVLWERTESKWRKKKDAINARTSAFEVDQEAKLAKYRGEVEFEMAKSRMRQREWRFDDEFKGRLFDTAQEAQLKQYQDEQKLNLLHFIGNQVSKRNKFIAKQDTKLAKLRQRYENKPEWEGFLAAHEQARTNYLKTQDSELATYQGKQIMKLQEFRWRQQRELTKNNDYRKALNTDQTAKENQFINSQNEKLAAHQRNLDSGRVRFLAKQEYLLRENDARRERVHKWIDEHSQKRGAKPNEPPADQPAAPPPRS